MQVSCFVMCHGSRWFSFVLFGRYLILFFQDKGCIVCFKDRTDSGKERYEIFSGEIFSWKENKNCLYKEMANYLKKKGEIVPKGEYL